MLGQIKGLHHVTSMAKDAAENNEFFTHTLGLRRVKKTVNFDAPDVYHLYYGDGHGTPGSVMTYFPFPNIGSGRRGTGEVGHHDLSVPEGTLGYWTEPLAGGQACAECAPTSPSVHERCASPARMATALRWSRIRPTRAHLGSRAALPADEAIRGFHSVVAAAAAMAARPRNC